jgi:hypothetical protein
MRSKAGRTEFPLDQIRYSEIEQSDEESSETEYEDEPADVSDWIESRND